MNSDWLNGYKINYIDLSRGLNCQRKREKAKKGDERGEKRREERKKQKTKKISTY